VQGVIFDWAGTIVDFGCMAPVKALTQLFAGHGVALTPEEVRAPMGSAKREHIADLLAIPAVAARWQAATGHPPAEADVEVLYAAFPSALDQVVATSGTLIQGTTEAATALRARGVKIGSCTGYTRQMMEPILCSAQAQGFIPDAVVCVDEVPAGRPAPWMCFHNAQVLEIYPMEALVKVGDTPLDILEGWHAGMWTVGVAMSGNEVGLTEAELQALPPAERAARRAAAYHRLQEAGAHVVVDTCADLLDAIDAIAARLTADELPK
jgi:phosphonoacetaldehyde hydrolase